MAYVITEPCIGVKDRACIAVCPCDCIQEGVIEVEGQTYDMLFIDPEICIDCGLCEPECPVNAIYPDLDVPSDSAQFVQINADYYRTQ